jgi:CheY-like chemotaxis protein
MSGANPASVLVIDDEPLVLTTIRNLLEDAGYRVIVADRGGAAIEILHSGQHNPDLALLDMTITDMDAGRVVAGLRAIKPDLRVLITSGYPFEDQSPEVLETGADGFLQKPFQPSVLQAKLQQLLGRSPA